ncbi:MAG: hypothetical protein JXL97_04205 [Bacteroidales bacterium]|nr:hypothetical protein [Bacteroidales bacterium]
MKKLIFLLLVAGFLFACSNNDESKRTFEYFEKNLKAEMTYEKIENVFGEPDRNIGSGINIYVYDLDDGTEIWIGYVDKIYYVYHQDKDETLLHELIKNE